jgi:hypothetical protein
VQRVRQPQVKFSVTKPDIEIYTGDVKKIWKCRELESWLMMESLELTYAQLYKDMYCETVDATTDVWKSTTGAA